MTFLLLKIIHVTSNNKTKFLWTVSVSLQTTFNYECTPISLQIKFEILILVFCYDT